MEILRLPPALRGLVLDLDRTLYPSTEGEAYLREGAEGEWRFICRQLDLPRHKAEHAVEAKRKEIEECQGRATSLTSALIALGIHKADWDQIRIECYFPKEHLKPNPRLHAALAKALRVVRLLIFSNSPRAVAERVMHAIGLHDLCIRVLGVDEVTAPKPDPEAFREAARIIGVSMAELVSVGDRRDIDCLVPLEVGYGGAVHVTGPDEVIDLCRTHL